MSKFSFILYIDIAAHKYHRRPSPTINRFDPWSYTFTRILLRSLLLQPGYLLARLIADFVWVSEATFPSSNCHPSNMVLAFTMTELPTVSKLYPSLCTLRSYCNQRKDTTHALLGPCPINKGTNQNQFHVSLIKKQLQLFW